MGSEGHHRVAPQPAPAPASVPETGAGQPYVTKRERALILFSTTSLTLAEIAEALDSTANSIGVMINSARKAGDPRATRSLAALAAKITVREPAPAEQAAPEPAEPEPDLPIVTMQEAGFRIIGPGGKAWATDETIYLTIELLADGHLHSLADMMKAGGWASPGQVQRKLGLIGDKLDAIGVRLVHLQGQGCKITRAGR